MVWRKLSPTRYIRQDSKGHIDIFLVIDDHKTFHRFNVYSDGELSHSQNFPTLSEAQNYLKFTMLQLGDITEKFYIH